MEVYIKVVFEKKNHPPRLFIFQKKIQPPELRVPYLIKETGGRGSKNKGMTSKVTSNTLSIWFWFWNRYDHTIDFGFSNLIKSCEFFFEVLSYEWPLRHMTDPSLQSIGIIIHVIALLEFFIKHRSNIFKDWINSLVCINSHHSIQYLQKIFEVSNSNLKPRMVCKPTWFFFMVVIST